MSITCKFVLSRKSDVYYSGDEVGGMITIRCFKMCQLEEILLEFYGNSVVQWWELDSREENIMHNDFSSREVADKAFYGQQQKHAWQQLQLDLPPNNRLQPHIEYDFKFSFHTPQEAPATYSCFYGRTEYGLRLLMRRAEKANKEFQKRIIIKNSLDLKQRLAHKKNCAVKVANDFGQITLQLPCSSFTPGQQIPYHLKYQTLQTDCKLLTELNCYTTCRMHSNCLKAKQIKQNVNKRKHLSTESTSSVNVPLHCQPSSMRDPELLITREYLLEALLIKGKKKVLLKASIPLTIGTMPCHAPLGDLQSFMCFSNWGSSLQGINEEANLHKLLDRSFPAGKEYFTCLQEDKHI